MYKTMEIWTWISDDFKEQLLILLEIWSWGYVYFEKRAVIIF